MFLIDEKKQDENALIKKFKLEKYFRDRRAVFVLNPNLITKDELNNRETSGAGTRMLPYYRVFDADLGMDVEMRYCKSNASKKTKEGNYVPNYKPRRFDYTGKQKQVFSTDEFLFLYLNPKCLNSPFYVKGTAWMYKLKDVEAESQIVLNKGKLLQECLEWINELPGAELRIKAKAMAISDNAKLKAHFTGAKKLTDGEIRARLTNAAIDMPEVFHKVFNNVTNDFYGAIQEAIDQGVIVKIHDGGRDKWKFSKGIYKDVDICTVPAGIDAELTLRDAIASDMSNLWLKLKESIAAIDIERKISGFTSESLNESTNQAMNIAHQNHVAPVNWPVVLSTSAIVSKAIDADIIGYDRNLKTYNFIDEEGFPGELLYDHENGDPKNHRASLVEFLDTEEGDQMLDKLKELLGIDEVVNETGDNAGKMVNDLTANGVIATTPKTNNNNKRGPKPKK